MVTKKEAELMERMTRVETKLDSTNHYIKNMDEKLDKFIYNADKVYERKERVDALCNKVNAIETSRKEDKKQSIHWFQYAFNAALTIALIVVSIMALR